MLKFQKHQRWSHPSRSTDILIVDVDCDNGWIAYYDLAAKKPSRRARKPAGTTKTRKNTKRIESKPKVMRGERLEALVEERSLIPSRQKFASDIWIPSGIKEANRKWYFEKRLATANKRWGVIRRIVENKDLVHAYLYGEGLPKSLCKEISAENNCSTVSIYRYLSMYFSRGSNRFALASDYSACGSNYKYIPDRQTNAKKRGRPSDTTNFCNMTDEHRREIDELLEDLGKKALRSVSLTDFYLAYDIKYQTNYVPVTDEFGYEQTFPVAKPEKECISESSFMHYVRKVVDYARFIISKDGRKAYDENHAPRRGRARDDLVAPAHRYEVDATVGDCYLLLPFFEALGLHSGRPIIYIVKDVYSSMIVGVHIGFDGPNWEGVLQALYNAFTDKVEFCARYGINISRELWPCQETCNNLAIDNGVEYPPMQMEALLMGEVGVQLVDITKIYSGKGKGGVESEFDGFNRAVIKFVPGRVFKLPIKGSRHASKLAALTHDDLMKQLINHIIRVNNTRFNEKLHDRVCSEEGVPATPVGVWSWGMKHLMDNGRGRHIPKEELIFSLMRIGRASTGKEGIKFRGLVYDSEYAHTQRWLSDDRRRPVKKLTVRYTDSSNEHIWFEHDGQVHKATLSESHCARYKGYTWGDTYHRKRFYRIEEAEIRRKRREMKRSQQLSAADITQSALESIAKKAKAEPISLADSVTKSILAKAKNNAFFRSMASALQTPVEVSSSEKSNLIRDQLDSQNDQKMFGGTQ